MTSSSCASAGPDADYVRMDFKSWDVTFALRSHTAAENRHARGLSAADTKEEVFQSSRLQRIMQEVSAWCCSPSPLIAVVQAHYPTARLQVSEDRGVSEEEVQEEVREILAEMGHSMFLPAVRIIALLLRPFIRSALHGIFVNREGLEQVYT